MLNASFLSDSLLNNSVDVSITLVGDDALGVIVHFLLAVCDVLVNVVNQRLVQLQLLLNLVITLEQLDGVPTQEAVINLALDGLFDMSDGMLNAASEHMGQLASLARLCSGNSHLSSLHAAFALQCADLNGLAAQLGAQSILSPFLRTRSIMLTAITTGMPSSISWVVRYRLRSMLVPSMIFRMASGFSLTK